MVEITELLVEPVQTNTDIVLISCLSAFASFYCWGPKLLFLCNRSLFVLADGVGQLSHRQPASHRGQSAPVSQLRVIERLPVGPSAGFGSSSRDELRVEFDPDAALRGGVGSASQLTAAIFWVTCHMSVRVGAVGGAPDRQGARAPQATHRPRSGRCVSPPTPPPLVRLEPLDGGFVCF